MYLSRLMPLHNSYIFHQLDTIDCRDIQAAVKVLSVYR
uniref:Uncharacterized protein n=1 Tax=Rheinheimera sp. BAL341 TaxID=1708203 RepID=A0A486XN69_9GAMM